MRFGAFFMRLFLTLSTLCILAMPIPSWAQNPPVLMPLPASLDLKGGQFIVCETFTVGLEGHRDAAIERSVQLFLAGLSRRTGMPLTNAVSAPKQATLVVQAEHGHKQPLELGEDESYELDITATGVSLRAPTTLGIQHGLQTFLQLVQISPQGFAVPILTIHDQPRFPWRGLLIDVARHFIPLEVLKRNLDGMAAVKLNVLHLHLSDYQGFRVESRKFPRLHELGSGGQYYTQAEIKDLISYAADRGIRILPEFDMPGHSTAWFVGYPELASAPGPYKVEKFWGVLDPVMDPTRHETYKFLDDFVAEMAELFPDAYFHIGGDEVNGKQWNSNAQIQEFIRSHHMKGNDDLQAYFNKKLQEILAKHGKIMMGWDEILHPELPKSTVVHSWRGQESLAKAARQGYSGVLSYGYYLDLMWPAARHYAIDPMAGDAANLSHEEKHRLLGGEACMWTEYANGENIDGRIWPRLAAIAERLWSPQTVQDPDSMYQRLQVISQWLDGVGLTHNSSYESMLERLAGTGDIAPLRTLADVVEPVKDYSREELAERPPTTTTPLNRLVDTARPESDTARIFLNLVNARLSDKTDAATDAAVRRYLALWRNNYVALMPLINRSFLLKEVAPLSEDLSALGAAGLQALDYLARGEHPPEAWRSAQMALLERARKPRAQLLLMIEPPVRKLVEASMK
jgi:hexosaminidase